MPTSRIPDDIRPALEELRDYMHGFYPERMESDPFPLEFWRIEDDELFYEVLGYLPLKMPMSEDGSVDLESLPEGYRLAYPIFSIEDDYFINGWTALTNAGERLLPSAIAAYDRIGMVSEARALQAALESCRRAPNDDDAAEAAYKSVPNAYADDERKFEALVSFFRTHANLFEQDDA